MCPPGASQPGEHPAGREPGRRAVAKTGLLIVYVPTVANLPVTVAVLHCTKNASEVLTRQRAGHKREQTMAVPLLEKSFHLGLVLKGEGRAWGRARHKRPESQGLKVGEQQVRTQVLRQILLAGTRNRNT